MVCIFSITQNMAISVLDGTFEHLSSWHKTETVLALYMNIFCLLDFLNKVRVSSLEAGGGIAMWNAKGLANTFS